MYGGVEAPHHIFSTIMLSHTDDLVSHPYDITIIGISYVGHINSSVWHKVCCYFIRSTYYLVRMTQGRLLFHTQDLASHLYDIAGVYLAHTDDLQIPPHDITAVLISYGRLNISSVWHTNSTPISYVGLTKWSLWHKVWYYLIRRT